MSQRLYFASDNGSGAHTKVIQSIEQANHAYTTAYGDDAYTEAAIESLKDAFGGEAEIFFTFNGTGANVVGLGTVARSFEAVFCADCSHIWADECAAPEKFFGGKLIPVAATAGKISATDVAATMGENRGVHHARPRVISITQSSEWGTLYSVDEIKALAEFAHEKDMLLHVDGARLANAAAALDCSLAAITTDAGVDLLSFGGTKNGLVLGEAIVFLRPELAQDAGFLRKQATQLASKMRFIACQFSALMADELWRQNALHANAMAARLAASLSDVKGVDLQAPVQVNALFPKLDPRFIDPLQAQCAFYLWDEASAIARWMTSFMTTTEEVDAFAALVREVSAKFYSN